MSLSPLPSSSLDELLTVCARATRELTRTLAQLEAIRDGMSPLLAGQQLSEWKETTAERITEEAHLLAFSTSVPAVVQRHRERSETLGRNDADRLFVNELIDSMPTSWTRRMHLAVETGALATSWLEVNTIEARISAVVFVIDSTLSRQGEAGTVSNPSAIRPG